jgi:hypothetical protein
MGLTMVIGAVFFAGMLAVLYFGYQQVEADRAEKAQAQADAEAAAPRPQRSADEVVFDLEHRIESDLRDVADILRRSPGGGPRLYQA